MEQSLQLDPWLFICVCVQNVVQCIHLYLTHEIFKKISQYLQMYVMSFTW